MIFSKSLTPILIILSLLFTGVQVGPGPVLTTVPTTFVHGGLVDAKEANLDLALNVATGMEMEWVSTSLDWSTIWSDKMKEPDFDSLEKFFTLAEQKDFKVLVSLVNPPEWAFLKTGPDPLKTAKLIAGLYSISPSTLKAIELFPGINTIQGWGRAPNPRAFMELFKTARSALDDLDADVILMPGFQPLIDTASGDMSDLAYLQELYSIEAEVPFSQIGIHYLDVTGQPMDDPQTLGGVTLRHYELVRKVMLQNKHIGGKIWITSFSWSQDISDKELQARWVSNAFSLMKAQLFIGAAFFTSLSPNANPKSETADQSLILSSESLHPACRLIAELFSVHEYLVTP